MARRTRWAVGLFVGATIGLAIGAIAGSLIGEALGDPEGEGFIGFLYGIRIGPFAGAGLAAIALWRADRRG